MKIKNVFVSQKAIELVKTIAEQNDNRAEAFRLVDEKYSYPKNTMAQCFGKLESSISKRKQNLHKKFGGKPQKIKRPKDKWKWPLRGKIFRVQI